MSLPNRVCDVLLNPPSMSKRDRASPQIVVRLDPSVTWEALIQRHLASLSPGARGRWLRTLLVAGFREECWARRTLDVSGSHWTNVDRTLPEIGRPSEVSTRESRPRESLPASSGTTKPFAALQGVMG